MINFLTEFPSIAVFGAFAISTLLTLACTPATIKFMKKFHVWQEVRDDGPQTHLAKQGTPTIGGIAMLIAADIAILLFRGFSPDAIAMVIAITLAGVVGFIDDFLKTVKHQSLGLNARGKLIGQFLIAIIYVLYAVNISGVLPMVKIPFLFMLDLGFLYTVFPIFGGLYVPWLYVILVSILIVGMCNAVNLTDGLDGLAAGAVCIAMGFMAIIGYKLDYLDSSCVVAAMAGAALGFLWYNCNPAEIFMGDTGSLMLGMGYGCLAVMTSTEVVSIIVGGLFVIEALSVSLQVLYFRARHKRIFLMAPLHHHFEKKGWSEIKVCISFWIVAAAFGAFGFLVFFVGHFR